MRLIVPPVVPRVPRQELVELGLRRSGDVGEHVGEPGLGIDIVELGGADEGVHGGRVSVPPRSEPANSQERLPRARGLIARSAALFDRQIRPSSRKRAKTSQRLSI